MEGKISLGQKTKLGKKKAKNGQRNLRLQNELNEIKEYTEKLKKKKKKKKTAKNKKTVFKQIIIFKDKMDVFQKGDIKTEKK